jgi:hypothetical protein
VGFRVDVHRGEGRDGQRAVPVVVEADDGQVAGRGEAEVAHGREDAQRHVVVESRDRGRRRVGGADLGQGVSRARSGFRN